MQDESEVSAMAEIQTALQQLWVKKCAILLLLLILFFYLYLYLIIYRVPDL